MFDKWSLSDRLLPGGVSLTLIALLAQPASARRQEQTPGDSVPHAYELWNACDGQPLRLDYLAAKARPALWFAAQEPLKPLVIPSQLPRLSEHPSRTVYYRITRLRSRKGDNDLYQSLIGGKKIGPSERIDPESFASVEFAPEAVALLDQVTIRYLFYYSTDVGLNGHAHDLEVLDLDIGVDRVQRNGKDCQVAWLRRAHGAGHGLALYTNTLDLEKVEEAANDAIKKAPPEAQSILMESRFKPPLTVLVEAGKHAVAPSRDGDGHFDFGSDINTSLADAWGIRDNFMHSLVSPRFNPTMVGERRLETGDLKAGDRDECGVPPWAPPAVPLANEGAKGGLNRVCPDQYVLERTTTLTAVCGTPETRDQSLSKYVDSVSKEDGNFLEMLLKGKGFCAKTQFDSSYNLKHFLSRKGFGAAPHNPGLSWSDFASATVRYDRGFGLSWTVPFGLRLKNHGWLVPRMTFANRDGTVTMESLDLNFTSSASAFLSPYARMGWDRLVCEGEEARDKRCRREVAINQLAGENPNDRFSSNQFATEVGVVVRVKHPSYNSGLWGGRVGIRWMRGRNPLFPRMVFEAGLTLW